MPPMMKLESLTTDPPVEIIQVDSGFLSIGRDTENHIVVDSSAVSRVHGCIMGVGNHWVFRDASSTNGSWLNGIKLQPGQMKLLRSGDVLQLADFPIRVTQFTWPGSSQTEIPSLLVFYQDTFEGEFALEPLQGFFRIGGNGANFYLDGSSGDAKQLEISNCGKYIQLDCAAGSVPVLSNGIVASGVSELHDRDEIVLGAYRIVVSDLQSAQVTDASLARPGAGSSPKADSSARAYDRPHLPEHLKRKIVSESDWESEAARRRVSSGKKFVFGTEPEMNETTSTIGLSRFTQQATGYEMSTSQRFSRAITDIDAQPQSPYTETVLLAVGVLFFFLIIFSLGFYVFMM